MKPVPTPWEDRLLVIQWRVAGSELPELVGSGATALATRNSLLATFSAGELEQAAAFTLRKRRDEWLLSRYAAKQLALKLGIAEDPRVCNVARPDLWIDGNPTTWFVSLSHSEPYAAAAIAREPIGIDVQVLRPLEERGAHLFLSPEEQGEVQTCTLEHRLLHFWCAKEAAWKQRSDEFATLRQLPLQLVEERADGLVFDTVETRLIGDVIVAITRPTS